MKILNGSLNNLIFFTAKDITDESTREPALGSFTVYYQLGAGSKAVMTDPTIVELDNTNMVGEYSLLIDEVLMTQLSDDKSEELIIHITQADMMTVTRFIEVYAKPNDGKFNS